MSKIAKIIKSNSIIALIVFSIFNWNNIIYANPEKKEINFVAYTNTDQVVLNTTKDTDISLITAYTPHSLLRLENTLELIELNKPNTTKDCLIISEVRGGDELVVFSLKELICDIGNKKFNTYKINGRAIYEAQLVSGEGLIQEYDAAILGIFQKKGDQLPGEVPGRADVKKKLKNSSALKIPKNTKIQGKFSLLNKID